MATQKFVAGFLFRNNREQVALVIKEKPSWQKGKYNGIGGKVEPGETEYAAMVREFKEETGLRVATWSPVAVLKVGEAEVHFFRSFLGDDLVLNSSNDVGEVLFWASWREYRQSAPLIPNLRWLLPMAADTDEPFGEITSGFSGK